MDNNLIELISQTVLEVVKEIEQPSNNLVPIGISARHIHLCQKDKETLFGKDYVLTYLKALSQPGQFACEETVDIVGPKGEIKNVRVLGPERSSTQVEVSMSDAIKLGIDLPVRSSGKIEGTPGLTIMTKLSWVKIDKGVIIADRHLHMTPQQAACFGFTEGEMVEAVIPGPKGGIMQHITVRVSPDYQLDLHVDTDDANAFILKQGQKVAVRKPTVSL